MFKNSMNFEMLKTIIKISALKYKDKYLLKIKYTIYGISLLVFFRIRFLNCFHKNVPI